MLFDATVLVILFCCMLSVLQVDKNESCLLWSVMYVCSACCAQNMLDRARQRRAALEARLSNSDLSAGHSPSVSDTNHGQASISLVCSWHNYCNTVILRAPVMDASGEWCCVLFCLLFSIALTVVLTVTLHYYSLSLLCNNSSWCILHFKCAYACESARHCLYHCMTFVLWYSGWQLNY